MYDLDLAFQAQLSVIGSMLISEKCVPMVLDKLRPEDFIDGTCRSTFTAIRKLAREGRPVDPISVVDAMQGGDRYIGWVREAMELTPTAANIGEYIPMSSENQKSKRETLLHFRVSAGEEILRRQEKLCRCTNEILRKLAAIA